MTLTLLLLACAGPSDSLPPGGGTSTGTEVCDEAGEDEDGDGLVNEEDPDCALAIWFTDGDGDGYGDESSPMEACFASEGAVAEAGDCDDADAAVNPAAKEFCEGEVDEDCDGLLDTADPGLDPDDMGAWYPDGDGDGYGVEAGAVKSCGQPDGYAPAAGDCDDDDRQVNPGEAEACGNGIDDNCSGASDGCGLTGPRSLASTTMHLREGGKYLLTAAGVGDVDGDGRDDIAFGFGGNSVANAVYVVPGGTTGEVGFAAASAMLQRWGAEGYDFGQVLAGGDMDGDGYSDVIVGDPGYDDDGSHGETKGRVYRYAGPLAGDLMYRDGVTTEWITEGGGRPELGHLATGDWNGDSRPDMLVYSEAEALVYGDLTPVGTGNVELLDLGEFEAKAGIYDDARIVSGGDTDGDGADDLAVGEGSWDNLGGRVILAVGAWSGTGSIDSPTVSTVIDADGDRQMFGIALAIDGDANGDGYDDLLVGDELDAGNAYLWFGPVGVGEMVPGDADCVIRGPTTDSYFGRSLAYVGDENGDGADDVLVAAPMYGDDEGAVFLFSGVIGPGELSTGDATAYWRSSTKDQEFGSLIGGAGDFDGDGNADLLFGDASDGVDIWIVSGGNP